jgi:hypothetical protein
MECPFWLLYLDSLHRLYGVYFPVTQNAKFGFGLVRFLINLSVFLLLILLLWVTNCFSNILQIRNFNVEFVKNKFVFYIRLFVMWKLWKSVICHCGHKPPNNMTILLLLLLLLYFRDFTLLGFPQQKTIDWGSWKFYMILCMNSFNFL